MRTLLLAAAIGFCSATMAAGADDWPQFRGPTGQGDALERQLPLTWSETEGIKWKTPLPGRGWSSPVVGDGRIWITAADEKAHDEVKRAQLLKSFDTVPVEE